MKVVVVVVDAGTRQSRKHGLVVCADAMHWTIIIIIIIIISRTSTGDA